MNTYIYGSSRGRCFEGEINCRNLFVKPGGKLMKLCKSAKDELENVPGDKIIYFISGIPDICSRDKSENYEESYLELYKDGQEIDHVEKFKNLIKDALRYLRTIPRCKIVFSTIATISFDVWNSTRMAQGKTKFLKYSARYPEMQEKLNSSLVEINNFITSVNAGNGVITPFLHSPVQKSKYGKVRYMYSKLVDGVHPSIELSEVWIGRLRAVVSENEANLL